jgi:phosphatidylinositol alpha-mannosyltransferase
LVLLGQADDLTKARALRSMDVYCAPNTGGESFGMILTEAMAAGTTVVASDIDAFRRVLDDGKAGMLAAVNDEAALAEALRDMMTDPVRRAELGDAATRRVAGFDWSIVAKQVLRVYETAIAATPGRVHEAGSG